MNSDLLLVLTVAIISLISAGITYLLFKKLSSFAEGQGKFWGSNIKYGGAIGGFVIVFGLLNFSMSQVKHSFVPVETNVEIDGIWYLKVTPDQKDTNLYGRAHIIQESGIKSFRINGEVRSSLNPPSISFFSHSATVENRSKKVVFIYENNLSEFGVAIGILLAEEPEHFFIKYYDIEGFDSNHDNTGRIDFSREPFLQQQKEKDLGTNELWYLGKESGQ